MLSHQNPSTLGMKVLSTIVVLASFVTGSSFLLRVPQRTFPCTTTLATTQDNDGVQEPKAAAEYGVSYIGGDPCGSKYNVDPFDRQVQKPGIPDYMKAIFKVLRIKEGSGKAQRFVSFRFQNKHFIFSPNRCCSKGKHTFRFVSFRLTSSERGIFVFLSSAHIQVSFLTSKGSIV
jgi:hypothetical protein